MQVLIDDSFIMDINSDCFHLVLFQVIDLNIYACKPSNQILLCVPVAGWELEINAVLDTVAQLHWS